MADTLISSLIQDAYREHNLIAAGTTPTANEVTEAVAEYNSLVTNLLQFLRSNSLLDVVTASVNLTLSKHSRIVMGAGTATITFPSGPDDGARMAAINPTAAAGTLTLTAQTGYTIEASATFSYTSATGNKEWFYRADTGDWKAVKAFASTDGSLFPPIFDDFIQALLAQRLAPRYNKQMQPATQAVIDRGNVQFIARYFQGARLDIADTNLRAKAQA